MRNPRPVVWIIIMIALGYLAFIGYSLVRKAKQSAAAQEGASAPLRVAVHEIRTDTLTRTVSVTGEVEPLAVVDVVPKVVGRLERLRLDDDTPVEEGVLVSKDDVVAVIEHSALDAGLEQAKAAQAVAIASHERAQVRLVEAEREKTRLENLFKQGSATEQQRDQTVTAYGACVAELKLAEAQLGQADAALRLAQIALSEATIKAPIAGMVTQKLVDEGDMVGPTRPLLRIAQIDTVKVVGGVSERHLAAVLPDKTAARVTTDAYPGADFDGVVHKVGAAVDRLTRTVSVEVRIPNAEHRLRPGMFARLELIVERKENVLVAPEAALLRQESVVYAFVVNGSKARRRVLTLGLSDRGLHEVTEGLQAGDLVIVRGQQLVRHGDAVTIATKE